ncbi:MULTISPECIES: asparagine synthase (glutamine-hydrolyzing) [Streptomyces]|uniref:asparagine synthase (glutamine-hydrolyzing) n=2 Tax=Streptomyces TaxID=1883 RepID=A0ABU4K3M0_9ACTN|nr:asparagine synthase (glutamine-hydrolyzing) [Streptomyces roseolus]MDX2292335.1 asparagine synthase (glutamine-hydrolyzing) [Streptomyces roseolus]
MCGLAGVARIDGAPLPADADVLLRRMAGAIAHRGPDDEAYFREGPIGLGFVRLSLVDPAGGGQPLSVEDGSLVLIANGEIYNHRELAAGLPAGTRLRTGSDCEVLLHLYRRDGLDFLDRVRGMFSLVLWDRDRGRLVFARDRFGIKPLFYHRDAERIVFGSEIKALFQDPSCPRELDWHAALGDQLTSGDPVFSDAPAHSYFKNIELVPPATVMTIDLADGATASHRYWDFPAYDGAREGSETELVKAYGETLAASVAECCMADVEIGLFLSGGIDSAAVAALASPRPRTFTALNGSTLVNGDAESGHRIAQGLGLVNHQVLLDTSYVPGIDEWKRHLWLLETPMAGPESFYKGEMYRHVGRHAPEIKAMLLGGGSDEFNGGYSGTIANGGEWPDFLANVERMGVRGAQRLNPALGAWWDQNDRPLLKRGALHEAVADSRVADAYGSYFRWNYRNVVQYNCWHEDRTAAGVGIEARVPFLDHRLIELVAAVPAALRAELVWDKQILRRSLRGVLPPDVVDRPKGPFFYGEGVAHTYRTFAAMLAQNGERLIDEATAGPGARHFLDADNIRAGLRALEDDPSSGHVEFLLRTVNLGLLEQMAADVPGPLVSWPAAAVPRSVPVADWDAEREAIEEQVLGDRSVTPDAVLARADNIQLLLDPDEPSLWYLTVDGAIEYVLDENEDPAWPSVLRALDGVRPLDKVLAEAGAELDDLKALLAESLELGIIAIASSAPAVTPDADGEN